MQKTHEISGHIHLPGKIFIKISNFGIILQRCLDPQCGEYMNSAPTITSNNAPEGIPEVSINDIPEELAKTFNELISIIS